MMWEFLNYPQPMEIEKTNTHMQDAEAYYTRAKMSMGIPAVLLPSAVIRVENIKAPATLREFPARCRRAIRLVQSTRYYQNRSLRRKVKMLRRIRDLEVW